MFRAIAACLCISGGCAVDDFTTDSEPVARPALTREHLTDDVAHYVLTVPVGSAPNARLRIHRIVREVAPNVPRRTRHAAMLLHGDFATFMTNFAGLATFLAGQDIDVWGLDRRWTLPAADGDVSDLATMSVAQELGDLRAALAIARGLRGSDERFAVAGFSHGGQLAYMAGSVDAARPPSERQIGALVSLDYFGDYGPDAADERAAACDNAAIEYDLVASGVTDSSNDFVITLGTLAASAPDDPSPFNPKRTNREVMLRFLGQTFVFGAAITPWYHLLAPIAEGGGLPTGLLLTTEAAAESWLASAPPHESMLEDADFNAQLCGDGTTPVDAPLSRIRVPLLYIGAAGGVGVLGVHATTQVASSDVTVLMAQLYPDDAFADYGHGDLLYAADARQRVWQPLAAWLAQH